jgi:hypothetical protein
LRIAIPIFLYYPGCFSFKNNCHISENKLHLDDMQLIAVPKGVALKKDYSRISQEKLAQAQPDPRADENFNRNSIPVVKVDVGESVEVDHRLPLDLNPRLAWGGAPQRQRVQSDPLCLTRGMSERNGHHISAMPRQSHPACEIWPNDADECPRLSVETPGILGGRHFCEIGAWHRQLHSRALLHLGDCRRPLSGPSERASGGVHVHIFLDLMSINIFRSECGEEGESEEIGNRTAVVETVCASLQGKGEIIWSFVGKSPQDCSLLPLNVSPALHCVAIYYGYPTASQFRLWCVADPPYWMSATLAEITRACLA